MSEPTPSVRAVTNYPWLPLIAPVLGAVATFFLARGNRVRRARSVALEDLRLAGDAVTVLGAQDPLVDQVTAHARRGVREYSNRRARADKAIGGWISLLVIAATSTLIGVPFYLNDAHSWWGLMLAGALGGIAGSLAESTVDRVRIWSALRAVPTAPRPTAPRPTAPRPDTI